MKFPEEIWLRIKRYLFKQVHPLFKQLSKNKIMFINAFCTYSEIDFDHENIIIRFPTKHITSHKYLGYSGDSYFWNPDMYNGKPGKMDDIYLIICSGCGTRLLWQRRFDVYSNVCLLGKDELVIDARGNCGPDNPNCMCSMSCPHCDNRKYFPFWVERLYFRKMYGLKQRDSTFDEYNVLNKYMLFFDGIIRDDYEYGDRYHYTQERLCWTRRETVLENFLLGRKQRERYEAPYIFTNDIQEAINKNEFMKNNKLNERPYYLTLTNIDINRLWCCSNFYENDLFI